MPTPVPSDRVGPLERSAKIQSLVWVEVIDNPDGPRQRGPVWRLFATIGRATAGFSVWLTPALTGAGGIVALFVGLTHWLLAPVAILLALGLVLGIGRSVWHAQVAELDASTALRITTENGEFADALAELARGVADLRRLPTAQRRARLDEIATQASDLVVYVLHRDVGGVRAVVYEVFGGREQGLRPLRWSSSGHRADPQPFLPGTARNTKALQLLRSRDELFVADIGNAPRDEWEGSGVGYNTFISAPILAWQTAFGMLTVDAPSTDDLSESDRWNIKLVASVLAIAFSVCVPE